MNPDSSECLVLNCSGFVPELVQSRLGLVRFTIHIGLYSDLFGVRVKNWFNSV